MSYWVASRADLLRLHVVCTEPYVFVFCLAQLYGQEGFPRKAMGFNIFTHASETPFAVHKP